MQTYLHIEKLNINTGIVDDLGCTPVDNNLEVIQDASYGLIEHIAGIINDDDEILEIVADVEKRLIETLRALDNQQPAIIPLFWENCTIFIKGRFVNDN